MKKSSFKILSAFIFLFSVFFSAAAENDGGTKNILCTTFPIYLFTKNITKGVKDVKVTLLIPPGTGCPHDYTVTPGDMRKLAAKNMILVMNGASLDDFFLKTVKKVNPKAVIIDSSGDIPLLSSDSTHKHPHHSHHSSSCNSCGDHGEETMKGRTGNPHLFASPFTALKVVQNIGEGLEKADSIHAAFYHRNMVEYMEKLRKLCRDFSIAAESFRIRKIVTRHDIFDYLASHLHLEIVAHIREGGGTSLNAREMLHIINKIKKAKAGVIFTEPQYSARSAEVIARECRIPFTELDPVANGPVNAPLDYYEKSMSRNLAAMRKVLMP
ncbi:MAG: zinc ABC transporter substrate-binding protein [Lentisphaeria bacterium]|nr:zinc ABC transporter substrate-binding protein [Lentisphaeria bacterium]